MRSQGYGDRILLRGVSSVRRDKSRWLRRSVTVRSVSDARAVKPRVKDVYLKMVQARSAEFTKQYLVSARYVKGKVIIDVDNECSDSAEVNQSVIMVQKRWRTRGLKYNWHYT